MGFARNPLIGGVGGYAVDSKHIFANNDARDSYFAEHPDEKVKGLLISVGSGFQEWNGTEWVEIDCPTKYIFNGKGYIYNRVKIN